MIYTEWSKSQHSPYLKITSITLIKQSINVNATKFFGLENYRPLDRKLWNLSENTWDLDPSTNIDVPIYPATILFVNPLEQAIALIYCKFNIRFNGTDEWFGSFRYVLHDLDETPPVYNPVINLEARDATKLDVKFLLFPMEKFIGTWKDPLDITYIDYFVSCADDHGNVVSSEVRRGHGGAIGGSF